MKRRDFLAFTAGGAAAVAIPLPRLAMTTPVAQAPKHLYVWAVAMARAGHPVSENMLRMALKVPAGQARALIGKLVSSGIVSAPNAAGVAQAVRPSATAAVQLNPVTPVAKKTKKDVARHIVNQIEDTIDSGETETKTATGAKQNATEADQA